MLPLESHTGRFNEWMNKPPDLGRRETTQLLVGLAYTLYKLGSLPQVTEPLLSVAPDAQAKSDMARRTVEISHLYNKAPKLFDDGTFYSLTQGKVESSSMGGDPLRYGPLLTDAAPFDLQHGFRDLAVTMELLNSQELKRLRKNVNRNKQLYFAALDDPTLATAGAIVRTIKTGVDYNPNATNSPRGMTLIERFDTGVTNCQEFSVVAATLLGSFGIPSNLCYVAHEASEGLRKAHAFPVFDFQGHAVIADATSHRLTYFSDYIDRLTGNDNNILYPIRVDSVFANVPHLPWNRNEWLQRGNVTLTPTSFTGDLQPAYSSEQ